MANPQQLIAMVQQRPQILIGVAVAVVALGVLVLFFWAPWNGGGGTAGADCPRVEKENKVLATADNIGKAIEIQALLAREGIRVDREDADGGKARVILRESATYCERDQALITLVQSGLMDRNIGLESFDKGDLTASREEKRIKLIRAQQGELARLIRKMEGIEDATVSLSIPEPTIFRKNQNAMSASVQVTIPSGARLTRDKVRSVINLMVGSIQGLDAEHVALSDTNGNTYNSVLDPATEMDDKLEERDLYMKQKVANQLDRLVGPGKYVVTVSTLLREAPTEVMTQQFNPQGDAIASIQTFSENLNAKSGSTGTAGGPVSSDVPTELQNALGGNSSSNRGYNRTGKEVTYANTKTQTLETRLPGMIEDISVAVTIDEANYPMTKGPGGSEPMSENELKRLIARAASPKVRVENVSLARIPFSDSTIPIKTSAEFSEEEGFNFWPWAIGALVVFGLFMMGSIFKRDDMAPHFEETQSQLQQLRELSSQQQQQLQATQHQTQLLMEAQQRSLAAGDVGHAAQLPSQKATDLKKTLNELKNALEEELDTEDIDLQIKSWIESS